MKTLVASLGLLAIACTHNPYEPGAGDSGGSGTQTLVVNGSAIAHPNIPNSGHPGDYATEINLRVSLNNTPVTTGTVTISSSSTRLNLTFNGTANNGGRWEGTVNGYDEVYQLDVTSGPDSISGVRVDGPDIHTISAPTAGASVDASAINMLTWNRAAMADNAQLRVSDGGDGLTIADSGSFAIPALTFKASKDSTRQATIQLTRTNQIVPTGAAGGSTFSVGVQQELDVILLACATCP